MPTLADRFLFAVDGLSQTLRVARFQGEEALNELFHFELTLVCDDISIAFDDVVGKAGQIILLGEDGTERYVCGIVSAFEQGDVAKKSAVYYATLVPKVWRLGNRFDCRIFQDLTAPDIIKQVFTQAGLAGADYRLSLQETYVTREYCVQYRESDWAFVSRLMEEEGIYCFFEHSEGKHVLVLGDKPAGHASIVAPATVLFRTPSGALGRAEHVRRFHQSQRIRPGKATLRDYNFKKPTLSLETKSEASADTDLEVYDYPGAYDAPSSTFAKLRLEERQALRIRAEGESACVRFASGQTFTLSEHPREDLNAKYTLTRIRHEGSQPIMGSSSGDDSGYENHFECIPATVPFRPPLVTPRPTVKGVQSAVVVGPSGDEIYTDELGRVKVQFYWDRIGVNDEKSSCWIRVSQVWAGEAWGAMHIPRIKQEVLVDFLEGDPDRPIIVGRVYHAANVVPYPLPANKTRSTVKSNSSTGGGGSNELCFEDKKGSEEVYLHAQKDWVIGVEHDKHQTVGHDETRLVQHDRTLQVGNDQTEVVGHSETFTVTVDRIKSVGNDENETIGHDRTIQVGNDHTESIGGNLSVSVSKDLSVEAGGSGSESIGKDMTGSIGGKYDLTVGSSMTLEVKASSSEDVKTDKTVTVGQKLTITVGDATVTVEKNGNITVQGKQLAVKIDGPVQVEGKKIAVKSSGEVNVEASGQVNVKGSGPMNLNASGAVKLKGANVDIN
jgi:type VI secretion system secreted protein VgrG